ncbi:MAG: hypothetical protein JWN04_554 [Myxococcaceae bacterium]|nr:hypothetical protein [Myxococcaceae bacterium]
MIHVITVKYAGDLSLVVDFDDDSHGLVDLRELIERVPVFAPLLDVALFARAYVDDGEVCWPGDLDLTATRLYAMAHGLPTPDTFEQALANERTMRARSHRRQHPSVPPAQE